MTKKLTGDPVADVIGILESTQSEIAEKCLADAIGGPVTWPCACGAKQPGECPITRLPINESSLSAERATESDVLGYVVVTLEKDLLRVSDPLYQTRKAAEEDAALPRARGVSAGVYGVVPLSSLPSSAALGEPVAWRYYLSENTGPTFTANADDPFVKAMRATPLYEAPRSATSATDDAEKVWEMVRFDIAELDRPEVANAFGGELVNALRATFMRGFREGKARG